MKRQDGSMEPIDLEDATVLQDKFDIITKIPKVVWYYKFEFVVHVETAKGWKLYLDVGGDAESIERYDPFSLKWEEHCKCGISRISVDEEPDIEKGINGSALNSLFVLFFTLLEHELSDILLGS